VGLTNLLDIGRSSLLSHQAAITTTSNNIANVSTEGYSRRESQFREIGPLSGVRREGIRRETDRYLASRLLLARGRVGTAASAANQLRAIERLFSDGEGSIGDRMDQFFASLRVLATSPSDEQLRRDLITQADSFADTVSNTALRLEDERRQADQQLDGLVGEVNDLIAEIAKINPRIVEFEAQGQDAGDLRDQRDLLLGGLAEILDVDAFEDDRGQLTVLFNGMTLVQGQSTSSIEAAADPALGGLQRIDLINPAGARSDVTGTLRRGQLGGLLGLRDDVIPAAQARVDQLAFDIATAFNAVHQSGFGLDAVTGRDFFNQPAAVTNAARNFQLVAGLEQNPGWVAASTTAALADGGNDNLLALQQLDGATLAFGGTRTFGEEVSEIMADIGRTVRDNQQTLDQATVELEQLSGMREAAVGVSIDEELVDITRFQRAFQAASRIITTVQQMYDVIFEL
jgi:flagellar hook-associated protein 1 FlgK